MSRNYTIIKLIVFIVILNFGSYLKENYIKAKLVKFSLKKVKFVRHVMPFNIVKGNLK